MYGETIRKHSTSRVEDSVGHPMREANFCVLLLFTPEAATAQGQSDVPLMGIPRWNKPIKKIDTFLQWFQLS